MMWGVIHGVGCNVDVHHHIGTIIWPFDAQLQRIVTGLTNLLSTSLAISGAVGYVN